MLHQQHPGARPHLLKLHQRLGIGRPETVDALVLVPHHKEIAGAPRQQGDDLVLDLGSVLGFVHTEIAVPVLKIPQHRRHSFEDLQGKDHLVVVVHPAPALQLRLVAVVEGGQIGQVGLQGRDALLVQGHVLDVGDGGAQLLEGAVGGVVLRHLLVELGEQTGQFPLVGHELGLLPVVAAAVILQDHRRHPVDGAEGQPLRQLRPEPGRKPGAHLPGGGHRVGHGQDGLRRDAPALHHVAQPGHQHGGLAAARHRQQQHRTVHGGHRRPLLVVEGRHMLLEKLLLLHGAGTSFQRFRMKQGSGAVSAQLAKSQTSTVYWVSGRERKKARAACFSLSPMTCPL